jgi:hypothetical protein
MIDSQEIIQDAQDQALEMDYPFTLALADIFGNMLFSVDTQLYEVFGENRVTISEAFKQAYMDQICRFFGVDTVRQYVDKY